MGSISRSLSRPLSLALSKMLDEDYSPVSRAAALLAGETQGLAIDFTEMSMIIKDTGTPANAFSGDPNSKLTYTSPSTKWIRNSAGVLVSGTTLRTEYDTSGNPLGIRVEEQRTNLFLNSRSPVTQDVTVSATAYTLSFYGTGSIARSGTSTGTLNGTGTSDRVSVTFTPTAGTLTLTVTGTVDFVQIEAGSFATSPIVTAGSTVTRAADRITLASTLFPLSATAGTIYGSSQHFVLNRSGSDGIVTLSNGTSSESIAIYRTGSSGSAKGEMLDGGVAQASYTQPTAVQPIKAAFAYEANNSNFASQGTAGTTDVSCTLPTMTSLVIGAIYDSTSFHTNGHIRQIMYLPRRMTNAEMQGLTA